MSKLKRWTNEENEILVQAIKANPHNITKACEDASIKLEGRTKCACLFHWYKALSPSDNPTKTSISFITVGSKTICANRKNSTNVEELPKKSNLWNKIKSLFNFK